MWFNNTGDAKIEEGDQIEVFEDIECMVMKIYSKYIFQN